VTEALTRIDDGHACDLVAARDCIKHLALPSLDVEQANQEVTVTEARTRIDDGQACASVDHTRFARVVGWPLARSR